jgi:hypothetical protein
MDKKFSFPEMVGKMSASQIIMEIELSVALEVYGDNIPAYRVKQMLEDLRKRMKEQEQEWENRAS